MFKEVKKISSDTNKIKSFYDILKSNKINIIIRKRIGSN